MFASGIGVQRDDAKAARYYLAAATGGVPRAMFDLAVLYARGRGVLKDDVAAVAWCERAAIAGAAAAVPGPGAGADVAEGLARFSARPPRLTNTVPRYSSAKPQGDGVVTQKILTTDKVPATASARRRQGLKVDVPLRRRRRVRDTDAWLYRCGGVRHRYPPVRHRRASVTMKAREWGRVKSNRRRWAKRAPRAAPSRPGGSGG